MVEKTIRDTKVRPAQTIDFKTMWYFSGTIMMVGFLILPAGVVLGSVNIYVGLVLVLVSIIIFSTHYRLKVDFGRQQYYDYLWILGMKTGEKRNFENIEYLYIKKSKMTQKMNLRVASSTISKEVYDGYLKFSEKNTIHLMTLENKSRLLEKLTALSSKLNVRVVDYAL
jgi:hypothetical protein